MNEEQKEQVKKVREEYSPKFEALGTDLHHLHQEEHKAVEAVLTDDQKVKWAELWKKHHGLSTKGSGTE